MPAKTDMTWEKSKLRWRKMHRGQLFTISCSALGCPPTKEASYRAANLWWAAKRVELANDPTPPPTKAKHPHHAVLRDLDERIAYAQKYDLLEEVQDLSEKRDIILGIPADDEATVDSVVNHSAETDEIIDLARAHGVTVPRTLDPNVKAFLFGRARIDDDRMQRELEQAIIPIDRTVGGQVQAWLASQEVKVSAGSISPGHHANVIACINLFKAKIGPNLPIDKINETTIQLYYDLLLSEVGIRRKDDKDKEGISRDYADKAFGIAKKFIRYLWRQRLIDMPRNLDDKQLGFKVQARAVPIMTIGEVKQLLGYAEGQLKLHLLLGLNCGMTQTDISDLKDEQVDWVHGRIVRKRSKTEDHENAPVVNYQLWSETFSLLKKYRSGTEIVLLTSHGTKWCWEEWKNGKYRSNDSIATIYNNLKRKIKEADQSYVPKPLKLLRKTSASLIETKTDYGRYVPHFLGHSPKSIADKHYRAPSEAVFDEILKWLGTQYGF